MRIEYSVESIFVHGRGAFWGVLDEESWPVAFFDQRSEAERYVEELALRNERKKR